MPQIFAFLWANVAVPFDAATAQMIAAIQGMIGARFIACVGAYFICTLLIACWGPDEDGFTRFFRQLGLAAVVYTLATTAPAFNTYVAGLIHGIVTAVGNAMAGVLQGGGPLNGIAFDRIATRVYASGLAVYKIIPLFSLKGIAFTIAVLIYWVLSFICLFIMFGIYLLSYIFTDFLISVGPLFIALFFFPYTRNWADGWVRQVATTVLVQIFVVALASFFIFVLNQVLTQVVHGLPVGLAEGGLAPAGAAGDGLVSAVMGLLLIAGCCFVFSILTGYIVMAARSIAGGAFNEISRLRVPSAGGVGGGGGYSGPAGHTGEQGPAGSHGQSGHAGPAGSAPADPGRQYAFNRSVGSAP